MAYLVLLEAVLLLLVCSSTQLYTQETSAPLGSHPLLEGLMGQQQSAAALVTALLQLVVSRPQQPAQLTLYTPPAEGSTGVMRLVRTAAGEACAALKSLLSQGPARAEMLNVYVSCARLLQSAPEASCEEGCTPNRRAHCKHPTRCTR